MAPVLVVVLITLLGVIASVIDIVNVITGRKELSQVTIQILAFIVLFIFLGLVHALFLFCFLYGFLAMYYIGWVVIREIIASFEPTTEQQIRYVEKQAEVNIERHSRNAIAEVDALIQRLNK